MTVKIERINRLDVIQQNFVDHQNCKLNYSYSGFPPPSEDLRTPNGPDRRDAQQRPKNIIGFHLTVLAVLPEPMVQECRAHFAAACGCGVHHTQRAAANVHVQPVRRNLLLTNRCRRGTARFVRSTRTPNYCDIVKSSATAISDNKPLSQFIL